MWEIKNEIREKTTGIRLCVLISKMTPLITVRRLTKGNDSVKCYLNCCLTIYNQNLKRYVCQYLVAS